MRAKAKALDYRLDVAAPSHGRLGKATLVAVNPETGKTITSAKLDVASPAERKKAVEHFVKALHPATEAQVEKLRGEVEALCARIMDKRREQEAREQSGSPEGVAVERAELLDEWAAAISRPLCLVNGRAYAAAWCQVKVTKEESDGSCGVSYRDCLVIVRDDGRAFSEGKVLPDALPLADLRLQVCLNGTPPPGRGWSGAGLKRYLAGERPNPADVFEMLVEAVDRFIDFDRSLASQREMCELVALYVVATYLLDGFNVVGYLWPNGEAGCGKTTLLQLVAEVAYLGLLILSGSSYPTLRDLADYGSTLAFDDAEAVMDAKRTDPDKRTLLLAGNRRGATISVKELKGDAWTTRHVHSFCARLFSAIRLPDNVLGSRSIIVPLVRSGDERRTKANVADPADWPCDRRRLIDDLWALGLAHLAELPEHDRQAAAGATLAGRALEPWRAVLGVAHWLEGLGVEGLFGRTEKLSVAYQRERGDYEEHDATRVLFRALLELTEGDTAADLAAREGITPANIAATMNKIAGAEDLADADKPFTSAKRVGWLMKRQRFKRAARDGKGKRWLVNREEAENAAIAYGIDLGAGDEKAAAGQGEEDSEVPF
jgi:hypothetical protein